MRVAATRNNALHLDEDVGSTFREMGNNPVSMLNKTAILLLLIGVFVTGGGMLQASERIELPEPSYAGEKSLEQLLKQRRSQRAYVDTALTLADISQLLWSAQGITHLQGFRTAPSAGALYPLELYLVVGNVSDLEQGIYHYQPDKNQLLKTSDDDVRHALSGATFSQEWVMQAPIVIVFTANYERTTEKYGERGIQYVHMEVGHSAQNLFLQAGALDLATVTVGAFDDESVTRILRLPENLVPMMLMPVGRKVSHVQRNLDKRTSDQH